jgi:hypothetical protein
LLSRTTSAVRRLSLSANFVEGRKALTLSLSGHYLNSVSGQLSYTTFFGGDDFNLLKDRDFVSFSLSYFF